MPHELKRNRSYEIFSQSTGVEIRATVRMHEESGQVLERSGRVQLRFFRLAPKAKPDDVTQIRFICTPDEAFELFLKIGQVAGSAVPCKEKLGPHTFVGGDQEAVTTLTVEKWERSGKGGYALTVGRHKDFISVPVPLTKFLFAGEFLKSLALDQCWVEKPARTG